VVRCYLRSHSRSPEARAARSAFPLTPTTKRYDMPPALSVMHPRLNATDYTQFLTSRFRRKARLASAVSHAAFVPQVTLAGWLGVPYRGAVYSLDKAKEACDARK